MFNPFCHLPGKGNHHGQLGLPLFYAWESVCALHNMTSYLSPRLWYRICTTSLLPRLWYRLPLSLHCRTGPTTRHGPAFPKTSVLYSACFPTSHLHQFLIFPDSLWECSVTFVYLSSRMFWENRPSAISGYSMYRPVAYSELSKPPNYRTYLPYLPPLHLSFFQWVTFLVTFLFAFSRGVFYIVGYEM